MIVPYGPMINAVAVMAGALVGMMIGSRLPERIRGIVFQGLGLCTLLIGFQMALGTKAPIILIFSMLIGGILGESLNLEKRLMQCGDKLKGRLKSKNPLFTDGLVNATVLFCIGAMSILGSFDEGLRGDRTVVFSKSIMDCFAAVALASIYGMGVFFAAIPVVVYQGLLVLFASALQPWLSEVLLRELSALGGLMIVGIGLNILEVTSIRLSNMLPALIMVVVLTLIFL